MRGLGQSQQSRLSFFFILIFGVIGCSSTQIEEAGFSDSPSPFSADASQSFNEWSESSKGIIEKVLVEDSYHEDLDNEEERLTSLNAEDEDELLLKELAKKDASFDEVAARIKKKSKYRIPVEVNRKVLRWIHYFTVRDRDRYQRFYERGLKYRPMILSVLEDKGVPSEIFYLALIESGFNPHARSRARATGMWQFMRATGRAYGLRQSYYHDDRRDPIQATRAAARHLKDLREEFGSWYLALAAYNAGPRRIKGAIRRGGTRNFWKLAKKRVLPRETMNYVPKFLAATIIGRDPKKFGFEINSVDAYPRLREKLVPEGIKLHDLATVTGISYQTLKKFNPHLRRSIVPRVRNATRFPVWIPETELAKFDQSQKAVASLKPIPIRTYQASARRVAHNGVYRVRRGDNLSLIARRHGISVRALRSYNRLGNRSRIYPGQRLRVVSRSTLSHSGKYRVRRGDNLYLIAKRHGMSLGQLKRLNGFGRRSRIYPGQILRVTQPGGTRASRATGVYRVQRGDNLYVIAKRHGMSLSEIRQANRLGRRSRIYPGQKLKVTSGSHSQGVYRVRRGDSLYGIAEKFGTSIRMIKKNNRLKKNRIYPGQKLKIRKI